jgi:hypothetical protein
VLERRPARCSKPCRGRCRDRRESACCASKSLAAAGSRARALAARQARGWRLRPSIRDCARWRHSAHPRTPEALPGSTTWRGERKVGWTRVCPQVGRAAQLPRNSASAFTGADAPTSEGAMSWHGTVGGGSFGADDPLTYGMHTAHRHAIGHPERVAPAISGSPTWTRTRDLRRKKWHTEDISPARAVVLYFQWHGRLERPARFGLGRSPTSLASRSSAVTVSGEFT